jgi:hypothetical protein
MGVHGGATDLVKSVTHQVVAGRPRHVASRPCGLTSTDFLHRLGHKTWPAGQGMWSAGHPLGPLVSDLAHCLLVLGTSPV